jgi:ribosome-associated protein
MDHDTSQGLDEILELAGTAARAASAKQGIDPLVLQVGSILAITDAFVITSGTNARQVRTIAEEVEAQVARASGRKPLRTEGLDTAGWVLIDYGDFVVHVFLDEVRRYYDLERLWADAPRIPWDPAAGDGESARRSASPA